MISWYLMYSAGTGGAEPMNDPNVKRCSGVYMGNAGNSRDSTAGGGDMGSAELDCTDQRYTRKKAGWKKHLKSTEKAPKKHFFGAF